MTNYRSAAEARDSGITYHLVTDDVWRASRGNQSYTPEAFEADGFIHCTNGTDELVRVANMFYVAEPARFTVLVLDVPAITSEVRYDDPNQVYPHIYGPLNTDAVIGQLDVERAPDGTFLSIGAPA